MRRRAPALIMALALALALTSCGAESGKAYHDGGTRTGALSHSAARRDIVQDGRYYAGSGGQVSRRADRESQWEQLGRQLRETLEDLMDGAGKAAGDAGRQAEQDTQRLTQDARRAADDLTRDRTAGQSRK